MGRVSAFHLFQIALIYAPGAAFIPAVLFTSFVSVILAGVVALILIGLIVAGFALRSRLAQHLGLDQDYE